MTRRFFIWLLPVLGMGAVLPPLPTPPRKHRKLMSPKGLEQERSYRKVAVRATAPIHARLAFAPTDFVLSIVKGQSNTVVLSWVNGNAPFMVQTKTDLNAPWLNMPQATMTRTKTITITQPRAFFRVQSYYLSLKAKAPPGQPRLTWDIPALT